MKSFKCREVGEDSSVLCDLKNRLKSFPKEEIGKTHIGGGDELFVSQVCNDRLETSLGLSVDIFN